METAPVGRFLFVRRDARVTERAERQEAAELP